MGYHLSNPGDYLDPGPNLVAIVREFGIYCSQKQDLEREVWGCASEPACPRHGQCEERKTSLLYSILRYAGIHGNIRHQRHQL